MLCFVDGDCVLRFAVVLLIVCMYVVLFVAVLLWVASFVCLYVNSVGEAGVFASGLMWI